MTRPPSSRTGMHVRREARLTDDHRYGVELSLAPIPQKSSQKNRPDAPYEGLPPDRWMPRTNAKYPGTPGRWGSGNSPRKLVFVRSPERYPVGAPRRAWRSPQTKMDANAAATQASRFPIDRKLAMLTTVSSESLASAAEFHRATSPASADLAATTVPNPMTRSLMPIVLMSNTEAPVGRSLPDKRIGAAGATTRPTPTRARSHPIASLLAIGTAAAYLRRPVGIH
jgi:hypothetical protein